MWRDPETASAGKPGTPRTSRLSPLLQAFELNPLRILRVGASATTAAAAFEAERVLTLARADMAPDTPDSLPWLPNPGLPEIQQAAQGIEEPLLRLKNQLLWFDFTLDPHGEALAAALCSRNEADVASYLQTPPPPAQALVPAPAPAAGEENATQELVEAQVAEDHAAIGFAINRANLCLLLAGCRIDGVWLSAGRSTRTAEPLPEKDWQAFGKIRAMPQAHLAVADAPSDETDDIRALWQDGFARWMALLGDPRLRSFIIARIEAIDDDFAQIDDAEAVEESIRAQLVDLSVQEIRFLLMGNRYGLTSALVSGLAASSIEGRILTPAMRPVRQLLQTELATLDPILERAEGDRAEPVAQYLRRLAIIRDRWLALDQGGIVGARDLIDQAAERAYLKLRQWEKPTVQTDGLLQQASGIASAQSLRERIATLRSQHQERRELVCHFCHVNDPDYDKSVVLKGKKETSRSQSFTTTTVHYSIWHRVVMRCGRCATFHDFERQVSLTLASFSVIAIVILGLIGIEAENVSQRPSYSYSGSGTNDSTDYSTSSAPNSADTGTSSRKPPAASTFNTTPVDSFAMTKPMANDTSSLTREELRYCLVTKIQIDAKDAELDRLGKIEMETPRYNRNIPAFNVLVKDFLSSCSRRRYLASIGDVKLGVESRRQKIEMAARESIR